MKVDRISLVAVIALAACAACAPEPRPSAPVMPVPVAPADPRPYSPPQPAAGAKVIVCEDMKPPYPTWSVSERAARDAAAPFTSAVMAGNQRPLSASAIPWAHYVNAVHNKLHPIFTDGYLASLCALDRKDPLNDPGLVTRLDITISPEGAIERVGVIKPSGQPTFDAAAVESFERLARLAPPDPSLLSADGRAHLQWELARNEIYGCSTLHARPFNLAPPAP